MKVNVNVVVMFCEMIVLLSFPHQIVNSIGKETENNSLPLGRTYQT